MQEINSPLAPKAIGPYVQANKIGDFIFTSGQLGINPETNVLADGVASQLHQLFNNLSNVLSKAGSSLNHVIKTTIYLASLDDYAVVNEIYGTYFSEVLPARSAFQVAKLPLDAKVEIEVIAYISE